MNPGHPFPIKSSDWPERDLVRVQASVIHGTGAFAKAPIPRGTRIIEYKGQRCRKGDLMAAAERGERKLTYVLNLDEELAIDGAKTYFDTNTSNHNHYFIEGANELVDIPSSSITVHGLPDAPTGMKIAHIDVVVRLVKA